jgi:hypothetical protein
MIQASKMFTKMQSVLAYPIAPPEGLWHLSLRKEPGMYYLYRYGDNALVAECDDFQVLHVRL